MNANQPFNTLNQINECPICMDAIDGLYNRVVTECGHAFHCSCLMKNVAHNGFGCPYCRTTMAKTPAAEESDENDEWLTNLTSFRIFHQHINGEEEPAETPAADEYDEEESIFDDDVLTSFRMFYQRINGEEEPAETLAAEDDDEYNSLLNDHPNSAYVAQNLAERGITMEDLVKNILFQEHSCWGQVYMEHERRSSEVYVQFREVINQFSPQAADIPTPVASSDSAISVPEVAESKSVSVSHSREFMIHV